jgi:diguanylate cyclase (GGDEF)-like protein
MPKILVVDDELSLQELMKDILTQEGYEVITASDGKEGLQKIFDESPDLILLDCNMPEMTGFEVMEKIRSNPMLVNKPVIMLTANVTEDYELKGIQLGIDYYITKPVKRAMLLAKMKTIMERKAQSMSVNPLSFLPGNTIIKAEAEKRIADNTPFAMVYIDLANFKSFNDRYGFQRGDEIIKHTAKLLVSVVQQYGVPGDFVGHIGGDDFIIITTPQSYSAICENIIRQFDETIRTFYDTEDRDRGYIVSVDRQGVKKNFPMMAINMGVISTDITRVTHYGELSSTAAQLKKLSKRNEKSSYVVNRRKED